MNERISEMNSILEDLYYSTSNMNMELTNKTVYSYLVRRNVSMNDLGKKINFVFYSNQSNEWENFFGRWIEKFKNVDNIDVFCSENWKYFCQFKNGQVTGLDFVKVYIPLDYEHIYEGVNRIFNFLAKSNIAHCSKVSSDIRFDDVVVRLNNLEDAKKLQNFVDNDRYIQKGLMKPNAFTISNNKVAYAYDGGLSYNSCVAKIIAVILIVVLKIKMLALRILI